LVEAVQSRLFSPVLLLQEQISGTHAAQQVEPKQAASQVSIKPGPCFKAKTSQGCNIAQHSLVFRNAAELMSMAYRSSQVPATRSSKVFRMQKTNLQAASGPVAPSTGNVGSTGTSTGHV